MSPREGMKKQDKPARRDAFDRLTDRLFAEFVRTADTDLVPRVVKYMRRAALEGAKFERQACARIAWQHGGKASGVLKNIRARSKRRDLSV